MPLIDYDEYTPSFTPGLRPAGDTEINEAQEKALKADVSDVFKAAFQRENVLGSILADDVRRGQPTAAFNPFEEDLTGYEEKAGSFVYLTTPEDVQKMKIQIDKQRDNESLLNETGALGASAGFAAGVFDLVNLIPVGGAALKTYTMGGSILKGAATTARAGLIGATASEALLQASQETRTIGESAANITGGTILSGVLGGAIGAYTGKSLTKVGKDIESELVVPHPDEVDVGEPNSVYVGSDSVGAMRTERETTLGEEKIAGAFGAEKLFGSLNPQMRLSTSPSVESRRAIQEVVATPFYTDKNAKGIANPTAIESLINIRDADAGNMIVNQTQSFAVYKKRMKEQGEKGMSPEEFRAEVSFANRRGDESVIPEVQKQARYIRTHVIDPLKLAGQEVKLLGKELKVKTALSYLTRMYDKQKIVAKRDEAKAIFTDSLKREHASMQAKAETRISELTAETDVKVLRIREEIKQKQADIDARIKKDVKDLEAKRLKQDVKKLKDDIKGLEVKVGEAERIVDLSEEEFGLMADDIIGNILGHSDARIPYDIKVSARGPFKERVLDFVRDEEIENFLINDSEVLGRKYIRTMSADIAIQEKYGTMDIIGDTGVITQKINSDYNNLIDKAKTEKERIKLENRRKRDLKDIAAMVDQIRGTYGRADNPDSIISRAGESLMKVNVITSLGGMTISAIPDLARNVMVHGVSRTMKDGVVPLITNMKGIKAAGKEVRSAGGAFEMELNNRTMSMHEIQDPYVGGSKFEKGLTSATNTFGKIVLMTPWNNSLKNISGIITQGRLIDSTASTAKGAVSKNDARYLNLMGIDVKMAKRIAGQVEKYGEDIKGKKIAGTDNWTDLGAQRAFRVAIRKEIDKTIVTPGAGDVPLVFKGTLAGRMVGQFKSFGFAATNKILISGLQERDANLINGWILSTGLGMMTYAFKTWDRGAELSDDPAVWIREGIDRSGNITMITGGEQLLNKVTRGHISASALMGAPPLTRYASRNVTGALLGPSLGKAQDIVSIIGSAAGAVTGDGEWTKSDTRASRRLTPFQNTMILRQLFDEMEEGINDSLGVE